MDPTCVRGIVINTFFLEQVSTGKRLVANALVLLIGLRTCAMVQSIVMMMVAVVVVGFI